jgi:hypothetical protein
MTLLFNCLKWLHRACSDDYKTKLGGDPNKILKTGTRDNVVPELRYRRQKERPCLTGVNRVKQSTGLHHTLFLNQRLNIVLNLLKSEGMPYTITFGQF